MERIVRTEAIAEDCTEEEVRADPWKYITESDDKEQVDYEVHQVTPND